MQDLTYITNLLFWEMIVQF